MEETNVLDEQSVDTTESGDTSGQPPVARKVLYDNMVKDKLYSKSFDEFNKQFSTPEKVAKLHDFLAQKGKYNKGGDAFKKQFFPELKPPTKEPAKPAEPQTAPVTESDPQKKNPAKSVPSAPASPNGSPTLPAQSNISPQSNPNDPFAANALNVQATAAQANKELQADQAKPVKSPVGTLLNDMRSSIPLRHVNPNVYTKDQFDQAQKAGYTPFYDPDQQNIQKAWADTHPGEQMPGINPLDHGDIKTGQAKKPLGDKVLDTLTPFYAGVAHGVADLANTVKDLDQAYMNLGVKAGILDAGQTQNAADRGDYLQGEFYKGANLGMDEQYLNNNPIHGLGQMVPMLLGGEANGAKIAGFGAWGAASHQVDQLQKAGVKFENGSDILFKSGSALINYFLMKNVFGTSLFKAAGQDTFNGIVGAAAADATKELAEQGVNRTSQDYVNYYMQKSLALADKIKLLGVGAVTTYAKVGTDFAIANLATTGIKATVNTMNKVAPLQPVTGDEVVKDISSPFYNGDTPVNGSLSQFVQNIITTPAMAFSALHALQSTGMLFNKSPYLNPVIADLQKDHSPEAVANLKIQLGKYGDANGWSQDDIRNTVGMIDNLADIAPKIPKDLHPAKYAEAVGLIVSRRQMEGLLETAQKERANLDPSLQGKATSFEELLTANIEQANDRLNTLVTDKPFTYFEHQGEYFKVQQDEKPIKITKARYDLEGVDNHRDSVGPESVVMPEGTADAKGNPLPPKENETVPENKPAAKEPVVKASVKPVKAADEVTKTKAVEATHAVTAKKNAFKLTPEEEFAESLFPIFGKNFGATKIKVNVGKGIEFTLDNALTPSQLNGGYPGITSGKSTIDGTMADGSKISWKWKDLKNDLNNITATDRSGKIVGEWNRDEKPIEDNAKPESPEVETPKANDHGKEGETKTKGQGRQDVLKPDEGTAAELGQPPVFSNEEEADRHFIENIEKSIPNKAEAAEYIAAHYHRQNFNPEHAADYKENLIHQALGNTQINARDYARFGDSNNLSGNKALARRIDKTNSKQDIDTIAHELSNDHVEVTPQDIVDFIDKYAESGSFVEGNKTPTQKLLVDKYAELTGGNLTDKRAEDAYNKQQEGYNKTKLSDQARQIIDDEGITLANIDKLRDEMFTGFPYSEEDFNNVKRYLDETAGTKTKEPSGTPAQSPGTKSEGVGESKPAETKPTKPAQAPRPITPEPRKSPVEAAKKLVARRNASPHGGEEVKKVTSALSDKDKAAVDVLRKRMREKLNLPPDQSYGGSDFDEELHDDGLKLTRLYFKAGIRSFPEFTDLMISDMGEDIVPYLSAFYEGAKRTPGFNIGEFDSTSDVDYYMTKLNEVADPVEAFVDQVKHEINAGSKLNITALEGIAAEAGLSPDIRTHLQEYVERALIELARDIVDNPLLDNDEKFAEINKLYDKQPAMHQRSSTKVLLQQYSTPLPYAFSAGTYLEALSPKSVYDPTAGTGMLLVAFDPNKAITNEIDPLRLEILKQLGYSPTAIDAAMLPMPPDNVDAVIINPPFGPARTPVPFNDYRFNKLDYIIPLQALRGLKNGGRAAIIIGGHSDYDKGMLMGSDFQFFNYLHHYYNVTDVINVDGGLYAKQGTSFPTRLILINGRKEVPQGYAPVENVEANKPVKSFEDLYNRIKGRISNDENPTVLQSKVDVHPPISTDIDRDVPGELFPREDRGNGNVPGKANNGNGGGSAAGQKSSGGGPGGETGLTNNVNKPAGDHPGDNAGKPVGTGNSGLEKFTAGAEAGNDGPEGVGEFKPGDRPVSANRPTAAELTENEKVPYEPASRLTQAGSVIPSNMAYETEKNLRELESLYGPVDTWVANELGYHDLDALNSAFFAEQVDAIGLAIHQMKQGKGMIVGDMTGIGKGRVAAGLIRWAVQQGKQPIFFTEKAGLFSDIYRDLRGIGSGHLVPFIINDEGGDNDPNVKKDDGTVIYKAGKINNKRHFFEKNIVPHGTKVIMTTYSQFSMGGAGLKRGYISNLIKDNYVFFDESHNMAGDSQVGAFFQGIIKDSAGATFLSATFAKRPDNMPVYATKTSLADANMSAQALQDAIVAGGNAMQEIISAQMVKAGQMIRRERDMTGVENNFTTLGVDKENKPNDIGKKHRDLADQVIDVCNAIIQFEKEHVFPAHEELQAKLRSEGKKIAKTKGSELSVSNTPFASKMFNVVNQMLLSIKAADAAHEAIRELRENNRKPLIKINSTMESFLKNEEYKDGDTVDDVSFAASLMAGLRKTLRYKIKNPNGVDTFAHFDISDLPPEAKVEWDRVIDMIHSASADMSISPIDNMIQILEKEGLKVGELTGRKMRLRLSDDGQSAQVENYKKDSHGIIHDFNNGRGGGKADVIIFNRSGATGFSMHADKSFKDQRQRIMITAQFELDINKEIQGRGRIDRTNQVVRGAYNYLLSSIPAETRLAMMLSDKLKKLQANTTAAQKSTANEVQVTDFLNKYGDKIVTDYLFNNRDVYEKLFQGDDPFKLNDTKAGGSPKSAEGAASRSTGRAALLKVAEQEKFYNEISDAYNDYIDYLNSTDQNDLAVKAINLEAKTLSKGVFIEGKHTPSPFGQDSMLEKVESNVLRKPMTGEELEAEISHNLDGMNPFEARRDLVVRLDARYEQAIQANIDHYKTIADKEYEKAKKKTAGNPELYKVAEAEIDKQLNDKITEARDRLDGARQKMEALFNFMTAGSGQMVPSSITNSDTRYTKGIFLGFSFKDKRVSNIFTPSNVIMKFAVLDGKRSITIPASMNEFVSALFAGRAQSSARDLASLNSLRGDWEDTVKNTKARENRYIVTGNILQAFTPNMGQLISYTTSDGKIEQGILMPKDFNPDKEGKSVTAVSMYERVMAMKGGDEITSADGKVIITREFDNSRTFNIQVPKSTKEGGKYFKNEKILDIVNNHNFYTFGKFMEARVESYKMMDFLKALEGEFSLKFNTGIDLKDESNDSADTGANKPAGLITPNSGELEPGEEDQGFINALAHERIQAMNYLPADRPLKKLPDIIKDLVDGLNIKVFYAASKRKGSAGTYNPTSGGIRLGIVNNLDVAIHEVGHALDDLFGIFDSIPAAQASAIMDELQWFADRGGSNPPAALTASKKIKYLKHEGIAEFVRAYAINPGETHRVAPLFYQHFQSSIPREAADLVVEFGQDYLRYINSTALDSIMANIEEAPKEQKSAYRKFIDSIFKQTPDFHLTPFDALQVRLTNSGHAFDKAYEYILNLSGGSMDSITPDHNARMQSLLFAGVDAKIGSFLDNGLVNGKNEPLIDGRTGSRMNMEWLMGAFDSTSEETLKQDQALSIAFMFAERTIEKAQQFGRDTNISGISAAGDATDTDIAIKFLAKEFSREMPKDQQKRVMEGARRYQLWSDKMLRYMVDKGRMSEQTYNDIKAKNLAYVAFLPVQENGPGIESYFDNVDKLTRSANMGSVKTVIKEMTGSTMFKRHPYVSLMQNTAAMVKEADRNEILQSFVEPMMNTIRGMGDGEVNPFANIMIEAGPAEKAQGKPVMMVYLKGNAKFYMFSQDAKDVYDYINGLTKMPQVPGMAKWVANAVRWTATHSPIFAKNHLIRSTFNRLILSRTGSGLGSFIEKGPNGQKELYALFGGSQNGYWLGNRIDYYKLQAQVIKDLASKGNTMIISPENWAKKGWKAYMDLLHQSDLVNRTAEFKHAYNMAIKPRSQGGLGYDHYNASMYAAFQAKDLLNASVAGTWMKVLNQIIPFSNVEVRGLVRNIKAAIEGNAKTRGLLALRYLLYLGLPVILMRMLAKMGGYEEDYDNLPAYQRDNGFNFKVPGQEGWVYIPKPYVSGLAASGLDRAFGSAGQYSDNAWEGYNKTIFQELFLMKPELAVGPYSALVEPLTNYSFFKQGPIVPRYEENKILSLRHAPGTASRLGKGVSWSLSPFYKDGDSVDPRYIDNMMQSTFSYYGEWAMQLSDIGSKESRNKFGLSNTGFIKEQATYGDVRVKKLYEVADDLGLTNSRPIRAIAGLIRKYYDTTDPDERKRLHSEIMNAAKDTYNSWMENDIYKEKIQSRGKPLTFN